MSSVADRLGRPDDMFTIGPGAILEVPPPLVRRRSVLVGAALGITTTALPRAALASSPGTLEPTGSFTYPSGSEVLLYWTGYDTSVTAVSAGTAANSTPASGDAQRGGVNAGTTTVAAAGGDSTSASWTIQNPGNELTISDGGGDVSPHLEWTITNTAGSGSLEVSSLTLYRVRNLNRGTDGDLRMAFYVSTSAGFAAPTLRRTIAVGNNLTRHIVVQLGLSGGGALGPGEVATVRAFPYRTDTSRDVRFIQHNSTDGDDNGVLRPLISGPDDVQKPIVGYRSDLDLDYPAEGTPYISGDHTVAFIGRTLA